MKIKTQKLILHFLKEHKKRYNHNADRNSFFDDFFSKGELVEIVEHIHGDSCLLKTNSDEFSEKELFSLIKHDSFFLSYLIEKLEAELGSFPNFSQVEVDEVFSFYSLVTHYLASKKVEYWDEYDRSNYRSILMKYGKTKQIFAIYSSDVKEEDKYSVTTPPSLLFDTLEEAEKEMKKISVERQLEEGDLKIMSLWKLTNL